MGRRYSTIKPSLVAEQLMRIRPRRINRIATAPEDSRVRINLTEEGILERLMALTCHIQNLIELRLVVQIA
jgi:hypothetical protein